MHSYLTKAVSTAILSLLAIASPHPSHAAGWLWNMPPNTVWLDSGRRNNVFYVGETVTLRPTAPGSVAYDVRDYWGNIVDQGPVGTTITPKVTQPGWYKIHLHGSAVQSPWGDSVGDAIFTILRKNPNFPTLPAPGISGGADPLLDLVFRGAAAIGPERHSVPDAGNPAAAIAKIDAEIALDKQWYANTDSVRPRPLMIAFPNGTANLDGVKQIVAHFKNDVKYWEPRNEPNDISGDQFAINEMKPFHDAVKSVDPTAKVMGPGVVSISLLPWIDQFLRAGGGQWIDTFSFHAYGNVNGDVWLARKCLDDLNTLLAKYGLQNIEKWQTEQGYFAASYGVYQPRLQGRWTMVQMMAYEQYGIPKEHNNFWYDRSGGFWDFPAWWSNEDGSLNPGAALMRVWSEELFGKQFVKALDFGTPGNQLYIGSQFAGSGKQLYALMSTGATDGSVELNVSGVSTVHVVSAFGVEQDVPVVNGKVTLAVPELPVYVETPAAVTVTPFNYGKNLTQTAGVTASANSVGGAPPVTSANDPARLINGFLESSYYGANDVWRCDTQSFPAWVDISFPAPITMDHVLIYAGVPWSLRGSLLDYDLQYQASNGQWVTIQSVKEPTKTFQAYSPINRTNEDSFYNDRWIFQHAFTPITTQKLRVYVRDVTWGGDATLEALNTGGQGGPHQITLREIEVYNVGSVTPTAPQAPLAVADSATATTAVPITINALANDSDPGNGPGPLSIQSVTVPANGTTAISGNQIVYTSNAGFSGTDWFNYTISNGAATSTSSVTVNVSKPAPTPGNGTGLKGDYFADQNLSTPALSRTDATVNFDWGNGSPDPAVPIDHFSARWSGQVQPQYSETYTFYTNSDDGVRLWVNGQQIINNWTDHAPVENSGTITLAAGQKYDIRAEYYESAGGAVCKLLWSSPSLAKQVIPQTQLHPAAATATPTTVTGTGTGLKGDYFSGQDLSSLALSRTDATVNFDWGNGSPDPSVPIDHFSARWSGQVQPQYSEAYTFYTNSDDGVRLWVNGQQIINNWTDHAPVENSGTITLAAGQKYDIRAEYYESAGGAVCKLLWSSPSLAKQVIPQTQLYPAATAPNQPPTAANDTATTSESTPVTINVLANDSDPDNGPKPLAIASTTQAANGTVAAVNGQIVYTPNAGFVGNDSFTYAISDGAATATATVAVTVKSAALAANLSGAGLTATDIGTGSTGSSRVLADNSWEINSASGGITGTSDSCHFESQQQSGDFQIVAKINSLTSTSPNARAGVMIRESAAADARCVMIAVTTGTQYRYAARTAAGGNATESAPADTYAFPNAWVMLQRTGNTITVTESSDDLTYRSVTTFTLPGLPDAVMAGVFCTSGLPGTNARAIVTNYGVTPITQQTGTATGLLAQYFDTSSGSARLVLQRTDATVNFDWGNGSPDPAVPIDHFSARWTGQVLPQYSETYTFYTNSDDGVRLWVNGQQIINNWTDHAPVENSGTITLTAGQKADIVLEYYENAGGAVCKLLWSSPSLAKQVIPQSALTASSTLGGLKGDYFADANLGTLKVSRTDATVDFDWGIGSPDPSLPTDFFSARWSGQVKAPVSGVYTFTTSSDDGVRLWVNNQLLVDNWTNHAPTENSGTITLQAGQQYSIRMEYYEATGGAVARLLWTPPGQTKSTIPSSALTPP